MFTGIVTDVGRIAVIESSGADARITIETGFDLSTVEIGASIACSGICLTVVEFGESRFTVDASAETRARTTLGEWGVGSPVNLERALRLGDELGGHIVSGHVDAVGRVFERRSDGEATRFGFEVPDDLAPFIAEKGSITIDGVSLTVNEVEGNRFGVAIIPHTARVTTFGLLEPGARVNLEVDMLARYVRRLIDAGAMPGGGT